MPHIESMIDDYVLNLLAPGERARLERHVASCTRCLGLLNAERGRTSSLVAALKDISAPSGRHLELLWPAVASAAGLGQGSVTSRRRVRWEPHWQQAAAGIALALLLFVGILGTAQRSDTWIFHMDAPATASLTASPTVTLTPTWTQPSYGPDSFALAHRVQPEDRPAATGTPETHTEIHAPEPPFNPPAPPASSR